MILSSIGFKLISETNSPFISGISFTFLVGVILPDYPFDKFWFSAHGLTSWLESRFLIGGP
jgi:hypothetical protein